VAQGQLCVGTVITFSDPAISELMAEAGYDFIWIDMEHGAIDLKTALGHIMAVRGTATAPFVRVPCNDANVIKPILDLAPAAIIVPMVNSAQEAEQAVATCKYPPRGVRGYGPRRGMDYGALSMSQYLQTADGQTMVFIQIEHIAAVRNIDDILSVAGLDGICLGLNDLSGSVGKLGQSNDPQIVQMIHTVIDKVRRTKLYSGVATGYDPATLRAWVDKGVQWVALNVDWANLFTQSRMVADAAHKIKP
jgi:2-dehydro-3-deoxyglucarate aldolase/4-hydroxy-2-oxoheptanedioate aldolase